MNKEEAKKRISQALEIKAREDSHIIGSPYVSWVETADKIDAIIDSLTIDHPKVKLPREVGEELDATVKYLKAGRTDTDAFDYMVGTLCDGSGREHHPSLSNWYDYTANVALILADAYRYGWEAEPEAKWYVQTPKEWWEDKNKPEYVDLDSMGISDGLKCKEYAAQFTSAELKQYHLDSDIFTLVPVWEGKGND